MLVAVTRAVSPTLAECELTHLPRDPINVANAVAEHAQYEETLRTLGATVVHAPAEPDLPDAVFVEDTALVFDEVAIMMRPGALARRPEVESMAKVLSAYKSVLGIQPPGTLDGGDVLRVGRTVYVGVSSRTNRDGVQQLDALLAQWGYAVNPIEITRCLHLKSAVTQVAERTLLINPRLVPQDCFPAMEMIAVAPVELGGANALWMSGAVVYPAHYPATAERLERAGLRVVPVPCAEVAKAEGGVTCCSVLFDADIR
jgi:dimethylargininase